MPSLSATSLNVRGMGGEPGFASPLQAARKRSIKDNLGVLMIQEHNMNPHKHQNFVDVAKLKGYTLIISYGKAVTTKSPYGAVRSY